MPSLHMFRFLILSSAIAMSFFCIQESLLADENEIGLADRFAVEPLILRELSKPNLRDVAKIYSLPLVCGSLTEGETNTNSAIHEAKQEADVMKQHQQGIALRKQHQARNEDVIQHPELHDESVNDQVGYSNPEAPQNIQQPQIYESAFAKSTDYLYRINSPLGPERPRNFTRAASFGPTVGAIKTLRPVEPPPGELRVNFYLYVGGCR